MICVGGAFFVRGSKKVTGLMGGCGHYEVGLLKTYLGSPRSRNDPLWEALRFVPSLSRWDCALLNTPLWMMVSPVRDILQTLISSLAQ